MMKNLKRQQDVYLKGANKDFDIYFSEVNETELSLAPEYIKDVKKIIPAECYKYLTLDNKSKALAETYISERVLGKASTNDAYHIAIPLLIG